MPMRKAVLEQNDTLKAKQLFLIEGMVDAEIILLTRDPLEVSIGVIELKDQTRIPGGRRRSGEFGVTLQFGRNGDRETFRQWFEMCQDEGRRGVDPTYKRNGTIIFERLFQGSPGTYNSGSNLPNVTAQIIGVWPSQMNIPDYDISADEGDDGSLSLEMTMQFDDCILLR